MFVWLGIGLSRLVMVLLLIVCVGVVVLLNGIEWSFGVEGLMLLFVVGFDEKLMILLVWL